MAQSSGRLRHVGVLIYGAEDSRAARVQVTALRDGLKNLGWAEGLNLRLDFRFASHRERVRECTVEIVRSAPDAIVVNTSRAAKALQTLTQTIPIVFAGVG